MNRMQMLHDHALIQEDDKDRAENWALMCAQFPKETVAFITNLVCEGASELADGFYANLLQDPQSASFLTHDLVNERLRRSLASWLTHIFKARTAEDFKEQILIQRRIGLTHARIGLPMRLVNDAFMILKRDLANRLVWSDLSRASIIHALQWVYETLDQAICLINETYLDEYVETAQAEKSFQNHAVEDHIVTECTLLKQALSKWCAAIQETITEGQIETLQTLPALSQSEFGYWLSHKAQLVFPDAPELSALSHCIERIDVLLEALKTDLTTEVEGFSLPTLQENLTLEVNLAEDLLTVAARRALEKDASTDPQTQLLDRRFLPAVLRREVTLSKKQGSAFGLVIIDVAPPEFVLPLADFCRDHIFAHDFLFCCRPERVIVLLTEADDSRIAGFAQDVSDYFQREYPNATKLAIGTALHDGQPDFAHTLEKAEPGLYGY